MKSKLKIVGIVIISIIVTVIIGVFIFLHISMPDFYRLCKKEMDIPGLKDGYIPQGLSYVDDEDMFLSCGYMNDGTASRIYAFNTEKEDYVLLSDELGSSDTTHAGGIACWKEYIFMAHDNVIAVYDLKEVKKALENHSHVQAITTFEVGFETAFCYVDKDILYVGEFYRAGNYETPKTHHLVTDSGDNHKAVICAYDLNELEYLEFKNIKPLYAYSITDLVQGMCIDENGKICLSTSWGLSFSHIYVYEPSLDKVDYTMKINDMNVPVYYLDSAHLVRDIKINPMCEELYYKDGKVYYINESASKKYIFGKFISGDKIYSLKID